MCSIHTRMLCCKAVIYDLCAHVLKMSAQIQGPFPNTCRHTQSNTLRCIVTQREELILHLPICILPSSQVKKHEQRADRISLHRTEPDSESPFFSFSLLSIPFFNFRYLTPLFYVPLSLVVALEASLHTHRNTGIHTAY